MFAIVIGFATIQTYCALPVFVPGVLRGINDIPKAVTITTTTTDLPTTTSTHGCNYNGVVYPYGNHQLGDDRSTNWCYGIVCQQDGQVYAWDNFNCHPTTIPPTTQTPPTIPAKGCQYNGQFYLDNTVIQESLDKNGNPCDVTFCNSKGVLVHRHTDCALVG